MDPPRPSDPAPAEAADRPQGPLPAAPAAPPPDLPGLSPRPAIPRPDARMDARWTGANLGAALILSLAAAGALAWRAASGRFELGPSPAAEERRVEATRERVNPNTASLPSLRRLPGLGPIRAAAILDYRQASGRPAPFRSLKDLESVHGIGPATAENLREYLEFPPAGR